MNKTTILFPFLIWSYLVLTAQTLPVQSQQPEPLFQSFLMTVAEDGKEIRDHFEIWEVSGDFSGSRPSCLIQAASFIVSDESRVNIWSHEAQRITHVRPGIFKVEMTGRLNPFSGLEVVIEFSKSRQRITNISGSMRSGTRGQSVRVFHVDRKNENRPLPPLRNPSWLLETQ